MKTLLAMGLIWLAAFPVKGQTSPEFHFPSGIHITDSVPSTGVKDQSMSPTCWAFGTNSLFESDLIRNYGIRLNLSEMFVARYAYIDKARRFLATGGTTYFEGGGQFHDVIRVVSRYGIVPEEVYNGRPNGESNHNHARLDTAMKRYIRHLLDNGKTDLGPQEIRQVNDTLDRYLGKVPSTFRYQTRTYTPWTFARDVLHFRGDYVEVVSFADKPLYQRFVLQDKYNWAADSFYNIRLSDMEMIVDTAIAKGWSVGWEGDVTEKGFRYFNGFAAVPDGNYDYDDERTASYKDETTQRDHMLHIIGLARDENDRKWYYMKNSWGEFSRYKGYLYMQDDYFRLKTMIMMVNKAALPATLRQKLGIE